MRGISLKFISICLFLNASVTVASEKEDLKKINAYLVIKDYRSACSEAEQCVQKNPNSKMILEARVQAHAKAGDEIAMLKSWDAVYARYPEELENRTVIENMAWGVIEKGMKSSSPVVRLYTILSAFQGQDARGVAVLAQGLKDSNTIIRTITLQFAASNRDAILKDEVLRLLNEEKIASVRLAAIKAAGAMHIRETHDLLIKIVGDEKSTLEEKAAAIQGIVAMLETCDRQEIAKLVKSPRAGLRMLACEVVMHFDQISEIDLIIPLVDDSHSTVRAAALHTLGILRVNNSQDISIADLALKRTEDGDHDVSITAAWLLTLIDPVKGQKAFERIFQHPEKEVRYHAAAALASTGKYGQDLTWRKFKEESDLYVRMNLAIGLIDQRMHTDIATDALVQGLKQKGERWMWKEDLFFRALMPSKVNHIDLIPNYPEAVNQLTRLEILNMLAVLNHPEAEKAIKTFLGERTWGITGFAAALLLCECDEKASKLVEELLEDSDLKVRTQAALVLSLWGKDEKALVVLQEIYATATRDIKERILESMGAIGSKSAIPFLIERLKEPHQSQRLIAASSLLQCLYH